MKKYYLPFMCLGMLSATLLSQNTYVTGNVPVKVQPNTLFYHGGDFVVTAAVTNDQVIKNNGNIKINGNFNNATANGTDGSNFVSLWESAGDYGQVIIRSGATSTGKLTMEKKAINPGTNAWGQFAIPFTFTTIGDAYLGLFGAAYQGGTRYNHSLMTWDNRVRPEFDHYDATSNVINPTDYVILNLTNDPYLVNDVMAGGVPELLYPGVPANGAHNITFKPSMYFTTENWDTWKNRRNYYREQYSTYIQDPLRDISSPHYGRYIFQFGNPYTSNIDLSRIGIDGDADGVYIADLLGVVKASNNGVEWGEENEAGENFTTGLLRATFNSATNTWGGDAGALIVRPFEAFYIALNNGAGTGDRVFNFQDGLKTFSSTPSIGSSGPFVLTGRNAENSEYNAEEYNSDNSIEDRAFSNSLATSMTASRSSFYQLRLNLYSENDTQLDNSVFVIVDSNSQTGVSQVLESEYPDFQKGFFLVQENAAGTEIETPNRAMQINAINPRYVAKPIQLFFEKETSDIDGYYVKAELFYRNIFTKLKPENVNYVDGNSFFFYDKAQDILLPITTDFSYYIERPEENLSSRYAIYWNGGPEVSSERMSVSDELAGATQVYKDGDVHKIRFDKSWNSADVSVYDLAGRSIFKKQGVKTDVDYVLDLPKTIVYVVKIQSDKGEIVTQKILK